MPDPAKTFYVTTPIYYVNARPHIGHAYTTIVADVLARRHRLLGQDVFFLTGTDEHGQKIERSAIAAGIPPQQFANQVSQSFRDLWRRMGITYTGFIRTTEPRHKQGVQHLFRTLEQNGFIYKGTYTGQYCVSDEAYVDGPPGILCPDCGRLTETVSEENYYFKLSAFQLPLLNLIESDTLKIRPDSARNEVLSFIRGNIVSPSSHDLSSRPEAARSDAAVERPAVAPATSPGENANQLPRTAANAPYVPGALKDLSISRTSFSWGVPVPGDEKHVIYVWLDALANYMTALGYGSADTTLFDKFWPANLHLVGKEITRFHCIYWPAFLLALNPALRELNPASQGTTEGVSSRPESQRSNDGAGRPAVESATHPGAPYLDSEMWASPEANKLWVAKMLPKEIVANGWLLFDNAKMSKSKGNVVRTETILAGFGDHVYGKQFPESTRADRDLFATDVLRYFLLREIPFGQDGSFSFDAMITRFNADLANGYGNLVSRTLSMTQKFFGGVHPNPPAVEAIQIACQIISDRALLDYATALDSCQFSRALESVTAMIAKLDAFLSSTAPWKAHPSDQALSLYVSAECLRVITLLLYPFMPDATAKTWIQLGLSEEDLLSSTAKASRIMVCPLYAGAPGANSASIPPRFKSSVADRFTDITRKQLTNMSDFQWGGLQPGTKLGPLSPIFPRADKGLAQTMADLESTPPPSLLHVANDEHDATTTDQTAFREAPLASVTAGTTDQPSAAEAASETRSSASSSLLSSRSAAEGSASLPGTPTPTPVSSRPESQRSEDAAERPAVAPANVGGTSVPAEPIGTFSTNPAAGPRTSTQPNGNPGAQVGGSYATTTATPAPTTPTHVDAEPSGIFASPASATPLSAALTDASPQITIDDFARIELRVARILVAERIPKADKLLRLEVDLGHEKRQILSGIAEWYTPESLVGRRIVVITNLAPRKMRGLDSHGMLLAASGPLDPANPASAKPALATFAEADSIPLGSRLR